MFKSIYNGFWVPGETGYTGSSYLSDKHYVSESRTFFQALNRTYGLVHHTPRDNEYNPAACIRLFRHFQIEAHDVFNRNGETSERRAISIRNLNAKPVSSDIMRILLAYTKDGKLIGDLRWAGQLLDRGIDSTTLDNSGPDTTCCIGFHPEEQKWYGWSHRAVYGFGAGSTCKKGDCGYQPVDKDDFLDDMVRFWDNEDYLNVKGKHTSQEVMTCESINLGGAEQKAVPTGEFEEGVYVEWTYSDNIPNEKLRSTISGIFNPYPESFGKGEWEAQNLSDAKQMAKDFAEGVS